MAEAYRKPKPLVTQIRINKPPKVTMETGKSLLHLHGTLEMFAARRKRGKAPVSLFLLEVVSGISPLSKPNLLEGGILAESHVTGRRALCSSQLCGPNFSAIVT